MAALHDALFKMGACGSDRPVPGSWRVASRRGFCGTSLGAWLPSGNRTWILALFTIAFEEQNAEATGAHCLMRRIDRHVLARPMAGRHHHLCRICRVAPETNVRALWCGGHPFHYARIDRPIAAG